MRSDRRLAIGFLSAGGWDTHANQGHANGQLANNLGNLGMPLHNCGKTFLSLVTR